MRPPSGSFSSLRPPGVCIMAGCCVAHAASERRDLPFSSHYTFWGAVRRLSEPRPNPGLASSFWPAATLDLRLIRRPVDDSGKVKAEIPAETVRALSEFFALRPAMGGWRVAIIDALDELNRFGLNALLKTLEEPPARSVIFLVSHGEQLVLPTIRSRCHEVRLSVLSEAETRAALALSGREGVDAERLMRLSPGRPGRAAQLDGDETLAAAAAGEDALRQLAAGDGRALHAALSLSSKSDATFAATVNAIRMGLEKRARNATDAITAGNWADAALQVGRLEAEARALNQDRAQTIAAALTLAAPLLQSRPE